MSGDLSRESSDRASDCFLKRFLLVSGLTRKKKQKLRSEDIQLHDCRSVINTLIDFTEHDDTGKLRVGISRNNWMKQEDTHSRTTRGHNIVVRFVDKNHG